MDAVERAAALREYAEQTASCTKCALAKGRTQVVFGSGSPSADLMFVGEAPGFHEDQQGVPFVGQAGKLLDRLLGGIGLTRADVMVVNVLKQLSTFAVHGAAREQASVSAPRAGGGCCGGSCGCGH